MLEDLISAVASQMGKKGGKIGGKRRLETMTREERVASAKKAAAASVIARRKKAAEKKTAAEKSAGKDKLPKRAHNPETAPGGQHTAKRKKT